MRRVSRLRIGIDANGDRARKCASGTIVIGRGIPLKGGLWFDRDGLSYGKADIEALPGKKAAIGSCGAGLGASVDYSVAGCMPLANAPHAVLHAMTGTSCRVLSLRNRHIPEMLGAIVKTRSIRVGMIRKGIRLDMPFHIEDSIVETRPLSAQEKGRDWIAWPLPAIADRAEMKKLLDFEDDSTLASLRGEFVPRIKERAMWRVQEVVATAATLCPLVAGIAGILLGADWARIWLSIFLGIEILHALELPLALRALAVKRPGTSLPYRILRVMTTGYPAWIPWKAGVFDPFPQPDESGLKTGQPGPVEASPDSANSPTGRRLPSIWMDMQYFTA